MTSARGRWVCERTGSTRLFALLVPLSLSFSRPIRSTCSILSASMSYAIVTWCSTAPPTNRFWAAPAILPAAEAMSLRPA